MGIRFRKIEARRAPPFPPVEERREERKKRLVFRVALLLFLVLTVAAGLLYWYWQSRWVITTGRVVAIQVQVASPAKGRIALLSVREGDQVVKGQLIAKLADEELIAELGRSEALLSEAGSRLTALERAGLDPMILARVEAAQRDLDLAREREKKAAAEVEQAKVVLERTKTVVERGKKLFLLRAITRDEWEKALTDWRKAQADHAAAQARLSEDRAAIRGAEKLLAKAKEALQYSQRKLANELTLLRLEVRRAEAEVEQAKARLSQMAILAPGDGIVSWLPRKVGEVVDHNDVILTLLDPREVWVEAYVSAADLSDLHDGREAWVKIEGLSNQWHRGRVSLFYPTERPAERIVPVGPQQARSPSQLSNLIHSVKIAFTDGIPAGLRPEMIARVWIVRTRR